MVLYVQYNTRNIFITDITITEISERLQVQTKTQTGFLFEWQSSSSIPLFKGQDFPPFIKKEVFNPFMPNVS